MSYQYSLPSGVYEKLKTFCSGRVYSMRAPQNPTSPFIIYQQISTSRWRDLEKKTALGQDTYQVDVYSDDQFEAKDIMRQIEDSIDGFSGLVYYGDESPQVNFVDIRDISAQDGGSFLEQDQEPFLYRYFTNFLITYKTTA